MKKTALAVFSLLTALFLILQPAAHAPTVTAETANPLESLSPKESQALITDLLYPYITEASDRYYRDYLRETPTVAPYLIELLSVVPQRKDPAMVYPSSFTVTVENSPYYGPHNSVGTDRITLHVDVVGEVHTVKFEHLTSYEIQPNYRDEIISRWPPN